MTNWRPPYPRQRNCHWGGPLRAAACGNIEKRTIFNNSCAGSGVCGDIRLPQVEREDSQALKRWRRKDHEEWSRNVTVESQALKRVPNLGTVPSALVLAVESEAGWTAKSRFASAVLSAIGSELPFHRYFMAGRRAAAAGLATGAIERSAHDWVRATFHPIYGYLLGLDDPRGVVDCLNAYNSRDYTRSWDQERDCLMAEYAEGGKSLRWTDRPPHWAVSSGRQGGFRLYASRISPDGFDDPRACQIVSFASIQYAVDQAQRRAESGDNAPRTLSSVAIDLGAEQSAAVEAVGVFEREGGMPIENLAHRLGCKKRTLERELQAVGLTAGKLRLASMVVGATNQLHSGARLTQIAADQGFSDLAHMTRVFKASCGLAPRALRGGQGDARPISGDRSNSLRA